MVAAARGGGAQPGLYIVHAHRHDAHARRRKYRLHESTAASQAVAVYRCVTVSGVERGQRRLKRGSGVESKQTAIPAVAWRCNIGTELFREAPAPAPGVREAREEERAERGRGHRRVVKDSNERVDDVTAPWKMGFSALI